MIRSPAVLKLMLAAGGVTLAFTSAPTQSALAGETWPSAATSGSAALSASPQWLADVAGVKLVAVDGSTLSLAPTEGGLSMALMSPSGATQRSSLAFLSDRLGTISDDADAGHVIGFFRETDTGIEAQYADGRTTSLAANAGGGVSMAIRTADGASSCLSWYPPDHVFSAAERKAAVDAFATRLGVAPKPRKAAAAATGCLPGSKTDRSKIAPNGAPLIVATHPDLGRHTPAKLSGKRESGSALQSVAVRESHVHSVDPPPAPQPQLISASATSAAVEPSQTPAMAIASKADPVKASALATTSALATATTQGRVAAAAAAAPVGSGASDCLSVDTDGTNLGFRNHCGYGVQFAYCLQRAGDAASNCSTGSKNGAVAANGFVAVLLDTNIRTADAEHEFRWVACSGEASSVVAHLDRADPPLGRCVLN